MSSNVTRRSFFKGAGLAALGGLSAAALSGCGHGYAAAEPTNPSAGDFGGPSWLGAPPSSMRPTSPRPSTPRCSWWAWAPAASRP